MLLYDRFMFAGRIRSKPFWGTLMIFSHLNMNRMIVVKGNSIYKINRGLVMERWILYSVVEGRLPADGNRNSISMTNVAFLWRNTKFLFDLSAVTDELLWWRLFNHNLLQIELWCWLRWPLIRTHGDIDIKLLRFLCCHSSVCAWWCNHHLVHVWYTLIHISLCKISSVENNTPYHGQDHYLHKWTPCWTSIQRCLQSYYEVWSSQQLSLWKSSLMKNQEALKQPRQQHQNIR